MPLKTQQALVEKSARIKKAIAAKAASLKPEAVRELKKRVRRASRRVRRMKAAETRRAAKVVKPEAPAS